jgi:hypothetical protein
VAAAAARSLDEKARAADFVPFQGESPVENGDFLPTAKFPTVPLIPAVVTTKAKPELSCPTSLDRSQVEKSHLGFVPLLGSLPSEEQGKQCSPGFGFEQTKVPLHPLLWNFDQTEPRSAQE